MKERIVKLDITAVTPEGHGVAREDGGKVVFVPDTAPGDIVTAGIIKELKNSSVARLISVGLPSPSRVAPDCEVCTKCGGCVFRHIDYKAEAEIKKGFVAEAFKRIAGKEIAVGDTVAGDPDFYRNKVQYPFAPGKNGECAFGYYARRSHRIIRYADCRLQDGIFHRIASACAELAGLYGVKAYDETAGKGVLRHIVMRKSPKGKVLVCLVVSKEDKAAERIALALPERFPEVAGVHINVNPRRDNVIFGDGTYRVCGSDTLEMALCGRTFALSPGSFFQVNTAMAEKLYNYAAGLIAPLAPETVLDLYCGVGSVGICVAPESAKLFGVEINPQAVENAKKNAALNGRSENDSRFICGDASLGVAECEKTFGSPDVIIVDPPRKGLEKAVIDTVVSASPKAVVYISCDPATLARDCAIFAESGYKFDFAQPFDLFPRTGHVETVVLLSRK
ncbi:MAG: 23S rRNA (uracil(1939)-C(5))-methyltransferase RlmD [Clostridia bacterium]|nr:23S rRNA (uracil(1939)-C(5))-methyltransferase RlmD [Clostridia bacterium]